MTVRKMPLFDAVSLQLEGKNTPMHVAALMTFSYPDGIAEADKKEFVSLMVRNWREEPRVVYPWNQVLTRPTKWQLRPTTREIFDLDLEYHLRQWSLPAPGGEKELGQMIAWIHELPMDLDKPLWECHFIEGLSENRFAVYVKIHHALVDGVSGTRLVVGSLSSDEKSLTVPIWAKASACENDARTTEAATSALPTYQELKAGLFASLKLRLRSDQQTTFRSTPKTILNGPIGSHRRVVTQNFELDRIKKLAGAGSATVNDVVMAIVGGALRDYLVNANALPEESLTAALPVSTREPGDTNVGCSECCQCLFAVFDRTFPVCRGAGNCSTRSPAVQYHHLQRFRTEGKPLPQWSKAAACIPGQSHYAGQSAEFYLFQPR